MDRQTRTLLENTVVRTKLLPPRLHQRIMARPRLIRRLLEALDYRLTILQAGAGYSKSTALAALPAEGHPVIWHHREAEDAHPMTFLLHLLHGFRTVCPEAVNLPLALLEEQGQQPPWAPLVDGLVDGLASHLHAASLLVLDDAHLLNKSVETLLILDRLIGRSPPTLHPILSTTSSYRRRKRKSGTVCRTTFGGLGRRCGGRRAFIWTP